MSAGTSTKNPIVFIHGLWLHAESWKAWIEFFRQNGYEAIAASWPGDADTTKSTREKPEAVAAELLVQLGGDLLGRDLAVAGVAIDPAPIKGVPELPLSALKSAFPVLGNPFNINRAISLTEAQFRFGFTNAVSEQEARELYAKYAMPAPARPLFQAATATFNPNSATKVRADNAARGPLLLIAGAADNTVPTVLVKSALKVYHKSSAVTEYKEFAKRGHSLTIDSGWRELAEYILNWLRTKGV